MCKFSHCLGLMHQQCTFFCTCWPMVVINIQVGRPRVQFACASALAMLVEGHPEVCPQVLRHGGIAALTIMLQTAGAQGKKAAAEALQVQPLHMLSTCQRAQHTFSLLGICGFCHGLEGLALRCCAFNIMLERNPAGMPPRPLKSVALFMLCTYHDVSAVRCCQHVCCKHLMQKSRVVCNLDREKSSGLWVTSRASCCLHQQQPASAFVWPAHVESCFP